MKNNQNTQSKPKRKPLFQEGTLLHTVFYKITQRVQAGEISFAKVFWLGLLANMILNVIVGTIFESNKMVISLLGGFYGIIYMQYLWHARKNVYHPAWFYIGFGLVSVAVLLILASIGMMV